MVTRTQRGPYTYADYLLTPDDVRCELIDGELIVAPTPIPLHQRIAMNFSNLLGPFVKANDLGELFAAPLDVFLSDTNVLQPDLLFVSAARAHVIYATNIQGAPDQVIEIASPSTEERDRGVKQELYALFGVLEYWRAYPLTQTVEDLRLENGQLVSVGLYGRGATLSTPLLPGLDIDLDEIFG
jgi:Uma2 family endonuclease